MTKLEIKPVKVAGKLYIISIDEVKEIEADKVETKRISAFAAEIDKQEGSNEFRTTVNKHIIQHLRHKKEVKEVGDDVFKVLTQWFKENQ